MISQPPLPRAAASADKILRAARMKEYPKRFWWCIAAFIAFIAVFQLLSWAISKFSSPCRSDNTQRPTSVEAGGAAPHHFSWRNIPTSLLNSYRVVAFRYTIKFGQSYTLNFAEVFVTCAYIVGLYTWEFVNTTDAEGQKFNVSYWAHRAGVLAASQLPLITALGMKNNIISFITGISYDKLNYIHRMAARVVFVLFWTHGGGEIMRIASDELNSWYVRLGISMMVFFSVLILVSLRPVRAEAYEVFRITHILVVLVILVGGCFHANEFHYATWVWPSLVIWGVDRTLRLARVIYYNHLYFSFFNKEAGMLDASVELLSPHLVRLHFHRPPHFTWTPGQTAYLTMPSVSRFSLESHPFTIASVDSRYQLDGGFASPTDTDGEKEKNPSSPSKTNASAAADVAPYWKELVFLIHVRAGFTRRLAASAEKGEKVKVFVDGPYGFSPNLDHDDAVVLVAGGSGVSFTLSTFLGVLSHVQTRKSRCRRVVFVWAIRDSSHIEWVSKALTAALERAPAALDIAIRIYVTSSPTTASPPVTVSKPTATAEKVQRQENQNTNQTWEEDDSVHSSDGSSVRKSRPPSLPHPPAVQVTQGRPDIQALLREEVDATVGRLSVTVCGSQGIAQACREALRIPLTTAFGGAPSVVLHVESFGYA